MENESVGLMVARSAVYTTLVAALDVHSDVRALELVDAIEAFIEAKIVAAKK